MKVWVIATSTFREAIRQPIFGILVALFGLMIAASPTFALFTLGQHNKMLIDLGLSSALVCGLFVAMFSATRVLAEEIENKTVLTVLSKPVRREAFLLGKYVGILLAVGLALVLLAVVFLFMLRMQRDDLTPAFGWITTVAVALACVGFAVGTLVLGKPPLAAFAVSVGAAAVAALVILTWAGGGTWEWRILAGLLQTFFHLAVLSALSLAVSTRLGLVPNMLVCITIFLLGHASNFLFGEKPTGLARVLYTLIPNFENFNYTNALASGRALGPEVIGWSAAYALVYCAFALLVAMALFADREVM
jgi:ABC-type transport system involved in multi-copper enzyme maturation permease subunit